MTTPIPYALEQLYEDQPKNWVIDSVPAVLAWVPDRHTPLALGPHLFHVAHIPVVGGTERVVTVSLTWDLAELQRHDPSVVDRAARYRTGQTVHREQLVETAAYGLAFVAISVFLPGAQVVGMRVGVAPDILYDDTPGALRGIEAAGRSSGGRSALRAVRLGSGKSPGKTKGLLALPDVLEAHISLWCNSPRVSEMVKVKP